MKKLNDENSNKYAEMIKEKENLEIETFAIVR